MNTQRSGGFTVLEMMVGVGILAVMATVAIVVINPAELYKQSRDYERLQELSLISKSVAIFEEQIRGGSTGVAKTVYVSVPDTSATCANLALPGLPATWSYACVDSAHLRNIDGSGWIPVNFTRLTGNMTPFAVLPIDSVNNVSQGYYYTYITGGSWAVTAGLESKKYRGSEGQNDGDGDALRVAVGTDTKLAQEANGLVANWKFDEGVGATATDSSGTGNTGAISGATWTTGKTGTGLSFNSSNAVVTVPDAGNLDLSSAFSVSMWIQPTSGKDSSDTQILLGKSSEKDAYGLIIKDKKINLLLNPNDELIYKTAVSSGWHHVVGTWDGKISRIYVDGVKVASAGESNSNSGKKDKEAKPISTNDNSLLIGSGASAKNKEFNGVIDEVRVYNRVLSPAEVTGFYTDGI